MSFVAVETVVSQKQLENIVPFENKLDMLVFLSFYFYFLFF